MWPWEHLAVGYLAYSLYSRVVLGRRPTGPDAVVLAFATQLPDLVDKPLSWGFDVFTVGYGAAHSLLVVVPVLCVAGLLVARRRLPGRPVAAYAVGHLSHLAGDLVYPVLRGEPLPVGRLLWPVASFPPRRISDSSSARSTTSSGTSTRSSRWTRAHCWSSSWGCLASSASSGWPTARRDRSPAGASSPPDFPTPPTEVPGTQRVDSPLHSGRHRVDQRTVGTGWISGRSAPGESGAIG